MNDRQMNDRQMLMLAILALELTAMDVDCSGPDCFYCEEDNVPHPPTHSAIRAKKTLQFIKEYDPTLFDA